jgi:hypothetical protein
VRDETILEVCKEVRVRVQLNSSTDIFVSVHSIRIGPQGLLAEVKRSSMEHWHVSEAELQDILEYGQWYELYVNTHDQSETPIVVDGCHCWFECSESTLQVGFEFADFDPKVNALVKLLQSDVHRSGQFSDLVEDRDERIEPEMSQPNSVGLGLWN